MCFRLDRKLFLLTSVPGWAVSQVPTYWPSSVTSFTWSPSETPLCRAHWLRASICDLATVVHHVSLNFRVFFLFIFTFPVPRAKWTSSRYSLRKWMEGWSSGILLVDDEACKSQNFPVIILRWWDFQHLYKEFKSLLYSVSEMVVKITSLYLSIQAAIICSNNYIVCFLLFTSNILKPAFPSACGFIKNSFL